MLLEALDSPQTSMIEQAVQHRLGSSSYLELHNLRCVCRAGVLALAGRLSSYYLVQVALSLVRDVAGVDLVDNQIVVVPSGRSMNP